MNRPETLSKSKRTALPTVVRRAWQSDNQSTIGAHADWDGKTNLAVESNFVFFVKVVFVRFRAEGDVRMIR
jgi:hypothetical protein